MNFSTTQIEAITQGVLQQLRSRGVVVSRGINGHAVASSVANAGLPLSDKVITEDSLAAIGAAGKTVQIASSAVITPSGHDYIRRNHITVETGSGSIATTSNGGVLVVMGTASAASSAASTAKWSTVEAGCEFEAAAKAKQSLPHSVVCCVAEPSTTACLLNRDQSIRAAVVTDKTDIGVLGSTMNPHVVCLNPNGWSFAAMLRLMRQMSANATAPSSWRELS